MLTSLALIFLFGLILGALFTKLKLPSLLGMIITGILLGPYCFNLLDSSVISISPDLRQLALVIILTRAGLSLNINDLKKVGRPAVLMCFLPACFEILAIIIFAPRFFNISTAEAALMGSVLGAVSPAVIVPRMLKIIEQNYGTSKAIPQLILAGASADDVFVIVLFSAFSSIVSAGNTDFFQILAIPVSILNGIILGYILGIILNKFFITVHLRDSVKILIILSFSFLLIELQNHLNGFFSGLIAVMSMGAAIYKVNNNLSIRLSNKYNKLWVGAEIILFVLVGANVDISYAFNSSIASIIIILIALIFRMSGVYICLVKTNLTFKERLFCMLAYIPKATVQAAIGAIPLSMGLDCGQIILTTAVLSILLTAPLGAVFIDNTYSKLLSNDN